jgi:Tfp pilus assembly protein PilF
VALAPDNADCIETRAEIFEKLGRREPAIADYRTALKIDPTMKEALAGLKRLRAIP